jgi:hypothetical protein
MIGTILAVLAAGVLIGGVVWATRRPQSPPAPAPPAAPDRPLTPQDVAALRAMPVCPICGGWHHGLCRRVTEAWFYPSGGIKHAILQDVWDQSRTMYPEDLPDEG